MWLRLQRLGEFEALNLYSALAYMAIVHRVLCIQTLNLTRE